MKASFTIPCGCYTTKLIRMAYTAQTRNTQFEKPLIIEIVQFYDKVQEDEDKLRDEIVFALDSIAWTTSDLITDIKSIAVASEFPRVEVAIKDVL